jgi:hypothetical protein
VEILLILLLLLLLFGGGWGWTMRPGYAHPEYGGWLGLLFAIVVIVVVLRLLGVL